MAAKQQSGENDSQVLVVSVVSSREWFCASVGASVASVRAPGAVTPSDVSPVVSCAIASFFAIESDLSSIVASIGEDRIALPEVRLYLYGC